MDPICLFHFCPDFVSLVQWIRKLRTQPTMTLSSIFTTKNTLIKLFDKVLHVSINNKLTLTFGNLCTSVNLSLSAGYYSRCFPEAAFASTDSFVLQLSQTLDFKCTQKGKRPRTQWLCSGLHAVRLVKYTKEINGYTTGWWNSTSFFHTDKLLHIT